MVMVKFYFNGIFIGYVTNLTVWVSEKDFKSYGPKVVVQFFSNKEVVEQWFIAQTLNYSKNSFNKIELFTDDYCYEILSLDSMMVIPIIGSNDWKFKIRVFKEERFKCSKNM